jgi:hypothetical protein
MHIHRALALVLSLGCLIAHRGVAVASPCPNLTILLDTSGSMLENPAGPVGTEDPTPSKRKCNIAIAALSNLVSEYDGILPIGLSIFPSDGMCGPAKLNIAPALFSGQSIISLLGKSAPTSFTPDTPTSASINSLAGMAPLKDPGRGQYILLLTDGRPECANGSESVNQTVTALRAAASATPPIKTFVVGFGMLDATSQAAMNQMADAGGVPSGDPTYHYYQAGDATSLGQALDKILVTISGELGNAMCDDSCYANGCPNPGDKCIGRMCQKDPCAGVSCSNGQYCYTDGTSPGTCVSVCATPCGAGTYCDRGQCVTAPCGAPCGPGTTCNQATKSCEADPQCANLTPKCVAPEGCVAGKCVDDPCASGLISCPAGSACTPWKGTCQSAGTDPGMPTDPGSGGVSSGGCSCDLSRASQGSMWMSALVAAGLLALLRRQRRRARRA